MTGYTRLRDHIKAVGGDEPVVQLDAVKVGINSAAVTVITPDEGEQYVCLIGYAINTAGGAVYQVRLNMTGSPEKAELIYEVLNASTLTLTKFSTTRISGRITCDRDGLLYTSIPQNGNWVAYVDGEKAEISLVGDCMVGLMLTEGPHTVQFRYENQSFRIGAWISAGSALIFISIAMGEYRLRRRKKTA
jgi:hypothetical protein